MQIFLLYLFLFIVGCSLGWVIEVLFRRLFSAKKWVNPGFMKGPWLPIYGFGLIIMFTMCLICISVFPNNVHFYNPLGNLFDCDYKSLPTAYDLIPIFLMWLGMVLLEFLAGIIFVKGFHVKLWDYSNIKGNIKGIVCPLFSIIWLMVAVVFYYLINPFVYVLSEHAYDYMFGHDGNVAHFGFVFSLGIIYGLLICDLVKSLGIFNTIINITKNLPILEKYENYKQKFNAIKSDNKRVDNRFKDKFLELFYIDPEKEKNKSSNYDESGRPIKDDTEQ